MMYKVVRYFTDLQDENHPYNVGDSYPREGLKVSEERIKELSSSNNLQNAPLIIKEEIKKEEPKVEEPIDEPVDEIKEEVVKEAKPRKKK